MNSETSDDRDLSEEIRAILPKLEAASLPLGQESEMRYNPDEESTSQILHRMNIGTEDNEPTDFLDELESYGIHVEQAQGQFGMALDTRGLAELQYAGLTHLMRRLIREELATGDYLHLSNPETKVRNPIAEYKIRFNILAREPYKSSNGSRHNIVKGKDELILCVHGDFVNPFDFTQGVDVLKNGSGLRRIYSHLLKNNFKPIFEQSLDYLRLELTLMLFDGDYHSFVRQTMKAANESMHTCKLLYG